MPRRSTRSWRSLVLVLCAAAAVLAPGRARAAVTSFQAFPVFFSPNGDGVSDRVRLTWILTDAAADVQVSVFTSPGNALVRRIDLGARPAGSDTTFWDGRDSTALSLPDGTYGVQLLETPAAGGTSAGLLAVTLDTTPPDLPTIDGPVDSAQVAVVRAVSGFAPGSDSVRVYLNGLLATTVVTTPLAGIPSYDANLQLQLGANQIAVQGKDLAGNLSALTPAVTDTWINAPDLVLVRATGVAFSPNGDGVLDSISVRVAVDAPTNRLVVDVRQGAIASVDTSTPVAHLYDGPAAALDTLRFTWDGRDSVGAPVPEGDYQFRTFIETFDAQGHTSLTQPLRSPITLDVTPPGTPLPVPPPPAVTFRNHLELRGVSAGAESVFVDSGSSRLAATNLPEFAFDVPLVLGPNVLTLRAADLAGNVSAVAGPYTVEYENPLGFHASERFRPNDAFVFNLERAASEVRVTLYSLRGRRVRTLIAREVQLHYDLPWDGRDDAGDFAGDGPYVAQAEVTFVDGTRREAKGAVVLVK